MKGSLVVGRWLADHLPPTYQPLFFTVQLVQYHPPSRMDSTDSTVGGMILFLLCSDHTFLAMMKKKPRELSEVRRTKGKSNAVT